MTLAPPERHDGAGVRIIDMRCSARPGGGPPCATTGTGSPSGSNRCQLLAGHGGPHALMYAAVERRRVLTWHTDGSPAPACEDWRGLSWMRGYPLPAWFETPG